MSLHKSLMVYSPATGIITRFRFVLGVKSWSWKCLPNPQRRWLPSYCERYRTSQQVSHDHPCLVRTALYCHPIEPVHLIPFSALPRMGYQSSCPGAAKKLRDTVLCLESKNLPRDSLRWARRLQAPRSKEEFGDRRHQE